MITRTWCDSFGVWHCEVTAPNGHGYLARQSAESAIRAEIRARNPRDLLTGLVVVGRRSAGDDTVWHWREEDGT